MALVTTTVTPELRYTPFTGISERERENSAIARAESVYYKNDIWPASGAGDNKGLIFTFDLSSSFAYVLTDMSCAFLTTNNTMRMKASSLVEFAIPSQNGTEYIYNAMSAVAGRQDNSGNTAIGTITADRYNMLFPTGTSTGSMIFTLTNSAPTYLLYPWYQDGNNVVSVSVMFGEEEDQEGAYSYRFACKFIQYDISQAYDYRLNTPLLLR